MSTTTQILFNSPALHSLKRDQLVRLCKIHLIKASGKNIELIDRLKQHAQTLPRDSPLSVAARSEGSATGVQNQNESPEQDHGGMDNPKWSFQMPRPSEHWQVAMESIQEAVEESSPQGTFSSSNTLNKGGPGEFGTGNSKSSTMSSSIRALASSLGLKRHDIKSTVVASSSSNSMPSLPSNSDELDQHSMPYSSLPRADVLPQTDHLTFAPPVQSRTELSTSEQQTPLPGQALRPGVPAPPNARLSLGLGVDTPSSKEPQSTTTIRLISNSLNPPPNPSGDTYVGRTPQLKPFKTTFDLIMGSPTSPTSGPGYRGVSLWPPDDSNNEGERLYPPLTVELPSASPDQDHMDTDADVPMPGSLPSQPPQTPATSTRLGIPSKDIEPFIFGSPLPQHNVSNAQFKTAAASVLDEINKRLQADGVQGVGMDIIGKLQPGAHVDGVEPIANRKVKLMPKRDGMTEKFKSLHEEEFKKMEGIDGFSKRRGILPKKSAAEIKRIAVAKKRKSMGHGAGRDRFGRRVGGETPVRLSERVIASEKKPRVLPGSFDGNDDDNDDDDGDGENGKSGEKRVSVDASAGGETNKDKVEDVEKEKDDEGKRKEREAIKRKLELNKARRKSSVGVAGARGRVSVGRGGVLIKPQSKPTRFGFLSSAKSLVQNVFGRGKAAAPTSASSSNLPKVAPRKIKKSAPPSLVQAPKKTLPIVISRPSTVVNSSSKSRATLLRTVLSSRTRSPISAFNPTPSTSTTSSLMSAASIRTSQSSSNTGASASKGGTLGGISSIDTRSFGSPNKLSGTTTSIGVNSMGSKKVVSAAGRSSSRLLAPTASSLAKTARTSTLKAGAEGNIVSRTKMGVSPGALGMITNSPAVGNGPWSPRTGGIFSKPLEVPSRILTPAKRPEVGSSVCSVTKGSGLTLQVVSDIGEIKDADSSVSTSVGSNKQRSLTGRKPRISRSKVIAKLASQRAASASGSSGTRVRGTPSQRGRVRSSLGAKVQRSAGGGRGKGSGGSDVMMSAKKRARQSEYARRKSRVEVLNLGATRGGGRRSGNDMDVDPE